MILGDEDEKMIERYLDVQAGSLEGVFDIAFVFGTKSDEFIPVLAEYLGREKIKKVLLTGGLNKSSGEVESLQHQKALLSRGIDASKIIVETRSKNTQENVSLGLEKLWSIYRYHEVKRMLVVTKWYHSRRALMALKAQLPSHVDLSNLSYEPESCTRENWTQNQDSLWLVTKEWKTIPQYQEFGHLAALDL